MPNPKKSRNLCPVCLKECQIHCQTYCSNKCFSRYIYLEYIEKWLAGVETGNKGGVVITVSDHVKRYLKEFHNNACQRCGWSQINPFTKKVPLEVHHISNDILDSSISNLELLCPNCHSLTENFRGAKKKGSGNTHIPKSKFKEYGLTK